MRQAAYGGGQSTGRWLYFTVILHKENVTNIKDKTLHPYKHKTSFETT